MNRVLASVAALGLAACQQPVGVEARKPDPTTTDAPTTIAEPESPLRGP